MHIQLAGIGNMMMMMAGIMSCKRQQQYLSRDPEG
jgi:hypothetical protein